jgi:hypothetical protein
MAILADPKGRRIRAKRFLFNAQRNVSFLSGQYTPKMTAIYRYWIRKGGKAQNWQAEVRKIGKEGPGQEWHHIVPQELTTDISGTGYELDGPENGIWLPKPLHNAIHNARLDDDDPIYNAVFKAKSAAGKLSNVGEIQDARDEMLRIYGLQGFLKAKRGYGL